METYFGTGLSGVLRRSGKTWLLLTACSEVFAFEKKIVSSSMYIVGMRTHMPDTFAPAVCPGKIPDIPIAGRKETKK